MLYLDSRVALHCLQPLAVSTYHLRIIPGRRLFSSTMQASSSKSTTLVVREAKSQDALRATAIELAAYATDPVAPALFPGPFGPDTNEQRISEIVKNQETNPACQWAKVVDTELESAGKEPMIAFTEWYFWTGGDASEQRRLTQWGAGTNKEACELLLGGAHKEWEKLFKGKPHAFLKMLHTDPAHQKRGAASQLIEWGTKKADDLGLACYLEASDVSRKLYERHGFEEVDKVAVDLSRWNGPADAKLTVMVRPKKDAAKSVA
ncbi:hypothetical protein HIM_06876 [Hirsutella minnesotensis 3608]|uniref:N-acetyltransferase domain-containing protein n=1 Tax=Hirsutella minnesotensis 3608 TaxID=1043627 RepID=A0A0F7ZTV2_9HYPO|nr:hypothetical protein HIM_06876 [Hirsutella minnesotensis 3608]